MVDHAWNVLFTKFAWLIFPFAFQYIISNAVMEENFVSALYKI